jgi:glucokinase
VRHHQAMASRADPTGGVVLALDLGGTQIRAAAVDHAGVVRHRRSEPTPSAVGPDAVVEACARALAQVAEAAALDDDAAWRSVLGIGISAPGPVDPARGVIIDPPNLGPSFRDVALAERVAAALGTPAFLDRDTQVAAMGEGTFGAARGCRDYLYVTVSTGIGGAVVSDGRLLRGPDGTAGELGHMLVDRSGPPCGCGARGHLEAIASGVAISRAARSAAEAGESADLAERIRAAGSSFGAEAGDPTARRIVDDACDAFAAASVSLVDVFDPDLIVVGGSLARGLGEQLLDPARAAVAATAFRVPARRVRFVPAALGDDVGLVGARVLVEDRLAAAGPAAPSPG